MRQAAIMVNTSELQNVIDDVREHVLYMQELGVETLALQPENLGSGASRSGDAPAVEITIRKPEILTPDTKFSDPRAESPKFETVRPAGSLLASLPSMAKRSPVSATIPEANETIEQIRAEIGSACERCKLSTLGRKQVVNSVGSYSAELMFVGEAPGADEDELGEPFVGRAGQLLTKIIESIGLTREQVFIGNINRCRPPGNRAPEPDESAVCKPFLFREIAVVRPRVIVVLGATAAQNLLETKVPIGKLRGQFHDYLGTKVMPTFHPAYLLRDPHKKREVWEDMKLVRDLLALK